MRRLCYLCLFIVITFALSNCISATSGTVPLLTVTSVLSSTVLPPPPTQIPTRTFSPELTATSTRLPTLTAEEAKETLKTLLQEPVDCAAPCFWGIVPGQSTFSEAISAITHFGLQLLYVNTLANKDFRESRYDFESGLSISTSLAIQDNIVQNLRVYITPEKRRTGVPRAWLAYSPETLINRYGLPSKVDFNVDRGEFPSYVIDIYFDSMDLIVEYTSYDLGANLRVCPLTDQIRSVRLWMGKNPENPPPPKLVPVDQATSMTIEEFSNLMTAKTNTACFNLKEEMFP